MQNSTFSATQADPDVLEELGGRLARTRLNRNWTQERLAGEAGVSRATVKRLEAGRSTQLTNLIRILRALDLLGNLEVLVPRPQVRPLEALEHEGQRRRRASSPRSSGQDEEPEPWSWGDSGSQA